jgi:hypothetical protein
MDRAWNERVIRAFAARRWDGELNDLVLGFDELAPYGTMPGRIPNRALDGFIDYFQKKHDCRVGCRDCRYCDDWAARAMSTTADGPGFVKRVGKALEKFESGEYRTLGGR